METAIRALDHLIGWPFRRLLKLLMAITGQGPLWHAWPNLVGKALRALLGKGGPEAQPNSAAMEESNA